MNIRVNNHIHLELLRTELAPALYALVDANRAYLREWLPWLDRTRSVTDVENFIHVVMRQYDSGLGPQYALFYRGVLCGVNGFHRIDTANRRAALGYWLDQGCTGRGIMTLTTRELLGIGFGEYRLNKIEIHCAVDNTRSRAIPERLGFTREAVLREQEWLYTRYVDHVIYSLLATEFR